MPGLGLVLALAVASTVVGKEFPLVGGPVTGIVLGVLLAALKKPGARLRPGIGFASKRILQASVVLLGSQLSLAQIVHVGVGSIPVMVGSLVVCLTAAYGIGRSASSGTCAR
ncbi:putative sulfate exporter family transporter [Streptomyces sp. NPDC020125]|uniref:putative sulfate exporter family transporter n=1 Tax=Streptomyces sp. NPDC020125 TaxID=3154593 RepID=UPI00340FC4C6